MQHGLAELRMASLKGVHPWALLPEEHRPTGIPVALPVFLRSVDQKGEAAILRYFVYSNVSFDAVSAALNEASAPTAEDPNPTMQLEFFFLKLLSILVIAVCLLFLAADYLMCCILRLRKRRQARGKKNSDIDLEGLLQYERILQRQSILLLDPYVFCRSSYIVEITV